MELCNIFFNNSPQSNPPFITEDSMITDAKEKASALVKHYKKISSDDGYDKPFIERKNMANIIVQNQNFNQRLDLPFNEDFSMYELTQALYNCKNSAPGDDGIHYSVLRNLPDSAKAELLQLFNQSWRLGKTPDAWNAATIIPLLKLNKARHDPASYRPISLTSTFTKLMQKMIKPRLCNHLEEYLKEYGLDVLDHPPYSPDLSPCDFWLFPRLKEMLAGHRFESRCGIGSAV